jgi:hypothetical protein
MNTEQFDRRALLEAEVFLDIDAALSLVHRRAAQAERIRDALNVHKHDDAVKWGECVHCLEQADTHLRAALGKIFGIFPPGIR